MESNLRPLDSELRYFTTESQILYGEQGPSEHRIQRCEVYF